ncbi:pyruvate kinase, partial [Mannheimia haemolytica]|nr:pyruvate kinase [Mannheimia haemolytica]MDW0377501.1 pyruvate kinase [Mannheimia haemolytica]MDW0382787.1 pyruvate kinase [Mannheimia haemolytica]MDW0385531.1 pyruvate kinase [Mannheimia haemolytica]MDW0388276.1 pyruvate kinase [Mannheimia haemolytica]
PFDLNKALAGEPVKLRNNDKAFVKYLISDDYIRDNKDHQVQGYTVDEENVFLSEVSWAVSGSHFNDGTIAQYDIVGMWEEPRPAVTLTLPCPLKEPQENMWFIDNDFTIVKSMFANAPFVKKFLPQGRCFASEEDAQEWLDAMRNSRR